MIFKRKIWSLALASVLCLGSFTPQINAETDTLEFSDVPKNKPYASAVYELAERKIISGYEDQTFKPDASITRGQAAAIITKLLNLDTEKVKDQGFKDVTPSLWSYKAISAVAEKGIFRGEGDGRFGPNDKITRAQMSSILIKAFEFHYFSYSYWTTPFQDIDRLASHQDSVYTLFKLGITSGTSETTFSPNAPISRAQAAVLIAKTERVKESRITLRASDYSWFRFRGYNDYHEYIHETEQNDDQIIQVIPDKKNSKVLQIVPMKEGTQKLSIYGQKQQNWDVGDEVKYKKYYVHVSNENGRLKINFEETEDILPTNARLNVSKEQIKNISLAKMDGAIVDENTNFHICKEHEESTVVCLPLTQAGEYIATVHYENGVTARYGISTELTPSSFYLRTFAREEIPVVTMDLRKSKGDFSEYKLFDNDIVKVTREGSSDIFHIEGLKEGNTVISFPKSEEKRGVVDGLNIRVQKIGTIIYVEVGKSYYEDRFY